MADAQVALWHCASEWRHDLEEAIEEQRGIQVCMRVVAEEQLVLPFHALVVPSEDTAITPRFVAGVQSRGAQVFVVHDPAGLDAQRIEADLDRLGADEVFVLPCTGEELRQKIVYAIETCEFDAEILLSEPTPADDTPPARVDEPAYSGTVTLVCGPAASQRTEIAVALAAGAAVRGEAVVLVEANDSGGGLAARLNLDLLPNVYEAATHGTVKTQAVMDTPAPFDALPGFPSAFAGWQQLAATAVWRVVGECADRYDHTIVLGGHCLDHLPFAGDTERYGLTRLAAARSDRVVLVVAPTAVDQAYDYLANLAPLVGETPIDVVINRPPEQHVAREISSRIYADLAPRAVHAFGEQAALFAAAWDGRVPSDRRYRRAAAAIAEAVLPYHVDSTKSPSGSQGAKFGRPGLITKNLRHRRSAKTTTPPPVRDVARPEVPSAGEAR